MASLISFLYFLLPFMVSQVAFLLVFADWDIFFSCTGFYDSLLALSPEDVLPTVYLCTNKIAADHENIVSLIHPWSLYSFSNQCLTGDTVFKFYFLSFEASIFF